MLNRREFLGTAAALGLPVQANDRITAAVVGTGGMGTSHVRLLAARKDARIAWVCDPDRRNAAAAAKVVEQAGGPAPQIASDLRKVLDDKAVDAVWIATPDHWHAPAAILAADAGKHVYVEKPCSHNIREGRLMIEAARRNKRVMQVGTQSRSTAHVRRAIELLRQGAIGEVLVARVWNSQKRGPIGRSKPQPPPEHLDYDLWLGPAPDFPYRTNVVHRNWRWWHAFGAGDIGNDGVHNIDIAVWGLGVAGHPALVAAIGGKYFFDDDMEWPDTQTVICEYSEEGSRRKQLIFEQRIWSPHVQETHENGNAFYGTKGYLVLGQQDGFVLYEGNKAGESMKGRADTAAHHQDFVDCIRSGTRPHADIEDGHLAATVVHLANIATRARRAIRFDPKAEQVLGDDEAARWIRREYRPGHWAVPKGV